MTRASAAVALSAGILLACASPAEEQTVAPDPPQPDQVIELTGRVAVTGSAPLTILVLVTETGHYEIVGDLAPELRKLQQLHVTVRGFIVRDAAGPGFPAQFQVDSYTRVRR